MVMSFFSLHSLLCFSDIKSETSHFCQCTVGGGAIQSHNFYPATFMRHPGETWLDNTERDGELREGGKR